MRPPVSIFDFPDLAPRASVDQPYDPLKPAGLLEIAWNKLVPPGFVNSGKFNLTTEWWNGDPTKGGTFVSYAPTADAAYSVGLTPTPEPATMGAAAIFLLPLAMVGLLRRRGLRS